MKEEAKKLAAENHNLIYGILNQKRLPVDDYYGIAAIGLVNAAETFDKEKENTFSTYAYKCMENEINRYFRDSYAEKRGSNVEDLSLDELNEEKGEQVFKRNQYTPPVEDVCLINNIYEKVIQTLSEKEKCILLLSQAGYTRKEISDRTGLAQRDVGSLLQSARMRFQVELSDKEIRFFNPRQKTAV